MKKTTSVVEEYASVPAETRGGGKAQSYVLEVPPSSYITPFDWGFRWGNMVVRRVTVVKGRLVLDVVIDPQVAGKHTAQGIQIHATPSGRLLVYDAKARRLRP